MWHTQKNEGFSHGLLFPKENAKKIQHQSWKVALSVCFYGVIVKSSKVQKVSIFQIVSHFIFQVMETQERNKKKHSQSDVKFNVIQLHISFCAINPDFRLKIDWFEGKYKDL